MIIKPRDYQTIKLISADDTTLTITDRADGGFQIILPATCIVRVCTSKEGIPKEIPHADRIYIQTKS